MPTADTVAARIESLRGHVPKLTLEELDALSGLSTGHTSQIIRGRTQRPDDETLEKLAVVLGTTKLFLAYGVGRAPGKRKVLGAVAAARSGGGGEHTAKVGGRRPRRKMNAGPGRRAVRSSRAAGRLR
jgi:hypothetical protein